MNGTEPLPYFRYHPAPLATGAVAASEKICACCNQARGYIYVGPVYSVNDLHDALCPWCIADGSAASKLDASFADSHPLARAGVPAEVMEEVNLRTPGYISWQQEWWLSHCGDACEFHGDASIQDIESASDSTKQAWLVSTSRTRRRADGSRRATNRVVTPLCTNSSVGTAGKCYLLGTYADQK
ncbi:CbrC family protein (plasmid) [Ralstonia wenshanensis]|uniref:CbrC family protein n=1 Tax=Ralstonia wenshanensis TaxID=2842456 RepID=UPI002377A08E|nr:CbrC family protein [Ralstonia wenshanensis]UGS88834.1 CbrC family protein [Ralstonia wenshanensis]